MRVRSMRFENSAIQRPRLHSLNLNRLHRRREPSDDSDRAHRSASQLSQKPHYRIVRLPIHRRSRYLQLPYISHTPRERRLFRSRPNLQRQPRSLALRHTVNDMRSFESLSEAEILALAISLEEEDERIYADYAQGLRRDFPGSASMFDAMRDEESEHRRQLIELYQQKFGNHIPLIRRQHVRGF